MAATDDMIDDLLGHIADDLSEQHRAEEGRFACAITDSRHVPGSVFPPAVIVNTECGDYEITVTRIA